MPHTYSVGPSSVVWSNELGPAPPFHQWECLKCNGHGLSVSCVKWCLCLFRWVCGHVTCIHEWTLWICRFVFDLNEINGRCAQIVLNLVMSESSRFNHWHGLGGLYDHSGRQRTFVVIVIEMFVWALEIMRKMTTTHSRTLRLGLYCWFALFWTKFDLMYGGWVYGLVYTKCPWP